jgi:hypothetical protein
MSIAFHFRLEPRALQECYRWIGPAMLITVIQ